MYSYTSRNVNVLSLIITTILFLILNHGSVNTFLNKFIPDVQKESLTNYELINKTKDKYINTIIQKQNNINNTANTQVKANISKKLRNDNKEWKIKIPKISLEAKIASGTSEEVMNKYVGHFKNTEKWKGNVGLAAHNRGYPVNYFNKLKELKIGDLIYYYTEFGEKKYKVIVTTIIKDTDWTYLKPTQDNRITLITCVENIPDKRRCVQAIEVI